MAPVKRHAYEADFKLMAISYAIKHGNRAAARQFNINESIVRKWKLLNRELQVEASLQSPFDLKQQRWHVKRRSTNFKEVLLCASVL